MSTRQEAFQKFLDLQRADYKRALPAKVAEVQARWQASETDPATPLADLERLAHTLAGTAGTLGFHELGHAAKSLETLLADAAAVGQGEEGDVSGPALTPAQRLDISQAIAALHASLPAD